MVVNRGHVAPQEVIHNFRREFRTFSGQWGAVALSPHLQGHFSHPWRIVSYWITILDFSPKPNLTLWRWTIPIRHKRIIVFIFKICLVWDGGENVA